MAEVELASEDEPFEKPSFIGREVTGDRRFYNSHMRQYPFKMWKDDIWLYTIPNWEFWIKDFELSVPDWEFLIKSHWAQETLGQRAYGLQFRG